MYRLKKPSHIMQFGQDMRRQDVLVWLYLENHPCGTSRQDPTSQQNCLWDTFALAMCWFFRLDRRNRNFRRCIHYSLWHSLRLLLIKMRTRLALQSVFAFFFAGVGIVTFQVLIMKSKANTLDTLGTWFWYRQSGNAIAKGTSTFLQSSHSVRKRIKSPRFV